MSVASPELVIGIVGRIGVDTVEVSSWLKQELHSLYYKSRVIKLTDHLKEVDVGVKLQDSPAEARFDTRIKACNLLRELSGRNDYFAMVAVVNIAFARQQATPQDDDFGIAYIVDQIKRPEEAKSLREVYGDQFILVSCHEPADLRRAGLAQKFAGGHAEAPNARNWEETAQILIAKDDSEADNDFGQRVGKVFHQADVIIDTSKPKEAKETLNRFFRALFQDPKVSPTRSEFFQNLAANVALTSCDTARQVGAAIEKEGYIVATGFNEAPKAFGGTYWAEDGVDARDVALGRDVNTILKRQMVIEIVEKLRDHGELQDGEIEAQEIEKKYLDGDDAPLKKTQVMSSLEFGRAVHAEMAAITGAARNGAAIGGANLYCTTFPCHNCAKHIVASGITSVVFLEPYPKSFVNHLYPDSIEVDSTDPCSQRVAFKQFIGITPVRYARLFKKSSSKDHQGYVTSWDPENALPAVEKMFQEQQEREPVFLKEFQEHVLSYDIEFARKLGLAEAD
ncbi:anti-phage dCTP deaminase [Thioclava sp. DLFJ4-1]|uniref:anti-phage dCTP deaminase n=1 Tax=Thioclava sp. DLFJ4-1 TaxID=1915313 RepID=UPI0009970441|nr:anti-phage dCTP deaminase [Thioclava sp. DLFJ4-1]OOY16702.1 hypothetical protein BMI85_06455 [Thioclava sp. DLFJ4-1]